MNELGGSEYVPTGPRRQLRRSTNERMIGGVAGGMAEFFDLDPTLVRVGWILFTLVGGVGPLLYLVMWAVVPDEWGERSAGAMGILVVFALLLLVPLCCAMTAVPFGVLGSILEY